MTARDPLADIDIAAIGDGNRHLAARAEAAHLQVVVFTHDLAFLFELNRAADDVQPKPSVAVSCISPGADKASFCRSEPPFKARRVSDITSKPSAASSCDETALSD